MNNLLSLNRTSFFQFYSRGSWVVKLFLMLLSFVYLLVNSSVSHSQPCTSNSAPTPQLGAMLNHQFSNLHKQAGVAEYREFSIY